LQLTTLELEGQMLLLQERPASASKRAAAAAGAGVMVLRSGRSKASAPARAASASMQQLLPKLQELKLSACTLSSTKPLLQLSRLTSLTSLQLQDIFTRSSQRTAQPGGQHDERLTSTLLPCLRQVQTLKLQVELLGTGLRSVTQQISSAVPLLRDLEVSVGFQAPWQDGLLTVLPVGLTHLKVVDCRILSAVPGEQRPATFPMQHLLQLPKLQGLHLCEVCISPISSQLLDAAAAS
jgi:hypothetical protein